MPVWAWMVIAAVAVMAIVAAIVAAGMVRFRFRTRRLKEHYGGEYERLVSETGTDKGAVRELSAREQQHDKLDIVALTPDALSEFSGRWREVQANFVDDPASAVGAADQLVTEVMRQRGYPVDDFDRRANDISVDHPNIVENYRAAHDVHLSSHADTEQQRGAFVHYRALFETLLDHPAGDGASPDTQEASA